MASHFEWPFCGYAASSDKTRLRSIQSSDLDPPSSQLAHLVEAIEILMDRMSKVLLGEIWGIQICESVGQLSSLHQNNIQSEKRQHFRCSQRVSSEPIGIWIWLDLENRNRKPLFMESDDCGKTYWNPPRFDGRHHGFLIGFFPRKPNNFNERRCRATALWSWRATSWCDFGTMGMDAGKTWGFPKPWQ